MPAQVHCPALLSRPPPPPPQPGTPKQQMPHCSPGWPRLEGQWLLPKPGWPANGLCEAFMLAGPGGGGLRAPRPPAPATGQQDGEAEGAPRGRSPNGTVTGPPARCSALQLPDYSSAHSGPPAHIPSGAAGASGTGEGESGGRPRPCPPCPHTLSFCRQSRAFSRCGNRSAERRAGVLPRHRARRARGRHLATASLLRGVPGLGVGARELEQGC